MCGVYRIIYRSEGAGFTSAFHPIAEGKRTSRHMAFVPMPAIPIATTYCSPRPAMNFNAVTLGRKQ